MPIGGCVIAISTRSNNLLDKGKLRLVFGPEGLLEEKTGKAIAASTITALPPPECRSAANK